MWLAVPLQKRSGAVGSGHGGRGGWLGTAGEHLLITPSLFQLRLRPERRAAAYGVLSGPVYRYLDGTLKCKMLVG